MSIRSKRIRGADARRSERGLSLVEMLVAMAIFVVLMAGLSLLFSGAIDAVRYGYVNQEAFERARSSMTVLERDLSSAFTAREFGDYYAFYGGPRGFSFVGVIDTGALARVTYVAHPTADAIRYESSISEKYEILRGRAYSQGYELGGEPAALDMQSRFDTFVSQEFGVTNDPENYSEYLDFDQAIVETQSIVRYVETDRNDLSTFQIKRADDSWVEWPILDRFDPDNDVFNDQDRDSLALYLMLLEGVNPDVRRVMNAGGYAYLPPDVESLRGILGQVIDAKDLRVILQLPYVLSAVRVFSLDDVDAIIQAKRRELWIRMLAGEPGLPEFWGDPNNTADKRPKAEHYVLAENILQRIYHPRFQNDPMLANFDLSGSPTLFTYWIAVNKEPKPAYFNDVRLIPHYNDYVTEAIGSLSPAPALAAFLLMDQGANGEGGLVSIFSSRTPSLAVEGMPLAPRLPAFIGAGFWVATPSRWVNAKDFLRWFAMEVNVPAAAGRDMQSVLTRREQT